MSWKFILKVRKRQACGHYLPPCIQGKWLTIDDRKNNTLASLCFASYLVANWLLKLETKHCLLRRSYFYSYACVVSQFYLCITKRNYLFVRCQSLSHIPNISLRCSNRPLWKLNLMTRVDTTKQQTGKIKSTIRRVI